MFAHENSVDDDDDEDDYEGYFLQPVNGYKIADKIILANKELFDESVPNDQQANASNSAPDDIGEPLQRQRLGSPGTSGENSSDSQRRVTFRPDLEDFEPEFITDIEDDDDDNDIDDASVSDDAEVTEALSPQSTTDLNRVLSPPEVAAVNVESPGANMSMNDSTVMAITSTEVEEICEEIEDFSLADSVNCLAKLSAPIAVESSAQNEEFGTDIDQLTECMTSPIDDCLVSVSDGAPSGRPRAPSLQRSESERSGSSHGSHIQHRHHEHNRRASASSASTTGDGDYLKIQLNFKPCCEYKFMENNRLPRYSGYFSQYGLSKEQLELRDQLRERSHRRKYKRIERKSEEETLKSQVNEEAFARWLQVKTKSAQSSTRNMYDFHAKQTKKSQQKKT